MTYSGNQTFPTSLVGAALPPHSTAQSTGLDVLRFLTRNLGCVVADKQSAVSVVAVACTRLIQDCHGTAVQWQALVVPHAGLPCACSNTIVGLSWAVGIGKRSAVQWHSQYDLVGSYALRGVVVDCLVRVEWGAGRVVGRRVEVGIVAGNCVPATRVVVGHEIPEIQVLVHLLQSFLAVVDWAWDCVSCFGILQRCR